jgi:phage protein U
MVDTTVGRGPSPMALGSFVFRALGFSFEGQGRELSTPWAEIDVCGTFDALQWMGPQSDSFAITGAIFDEAFGGQASLDGIRAAAQAGRPLMLVTRAGRVHGLHVVFGVSEDRSVISGSGQARINSYQIELRRYPGNAGGLGGLLGRLF